MGLFVKYTHLINHDTFYHLIHFFPNLFQHPRVCSHEHKFYKMKKLYILALGAIGLTNLSIAQNSFQELNSVNYGETIKEKSFDINSSRASQTCIDTVDYALYRAIDATGGVSYAQVTLEDSATSINGMGIFFPVPSGQTLTVSGMEFLANGIRFDGNASQVIVSVYTAGADSMPTGTALVTSTVSIDTNSATFGDIYNVTALTPTTVSSSFVVTVEAGSPTDSLVIITGGAASMGGQFDGFPTNLAIGGSWVRLQGTSVLGVIVPRIHPIISYDAKNTLSANVTKLTSANEAVTFHTTSPLIGETVLAYTGLLANTNTSSINFGDGNAINGSTQSPTNTYVDETQSYIVTLVDTIVLYQNNVGMCIVSETMTILKADPNGINDISNGNFFAYATNGEVVIGNGTGNAVLYSITGLEVKRSIISNQLEKMNVSDLASGVYILQVDNKVVKLNL